MPHPSPHPTRGFRPNAWLRPWLVAALAIALLLPAACGSDQDEEAIVVPTPQPAAMAPLPTATKPEADDATATAEAREEANASDGDADSEGDGDPDDAADGGAAAAPAELPAEPDRAIIQLARVEPSPWEPALLAQMTPHFSMQANGRIVFQFPVGGSEDGWYQSAITTGEARDFLRLLVDDIGVLQLAEARPEPEITFRTPADGSPPTCQGSSQVDAVGVVYVRSAESEGRLIFSQCDLVNPQGEHAEALRELQKALNLVQLWKQGLFREFSPDEKDAVRSLMGWWSDLRAPYTPESVVAYGTRARRGIPATAPRAQWPLPSDLSTVFDADYGAEPVERRYTAPDHIALIRAARQGVGSTWGPRFWGPLWSDGSGVGYLVGLRAAVPGGNHLVFDYDHVLPKRGIGAGR